MSGLHFQLPSLRDDGEVYGFPKDLANSAVDGVGVPCNNIQSSCVEFLEPLPAAGRTSREVRLLIIREGVTTASRPP